MVRNFKEMDIRKLRDRALKLPRYNDKSSAENLRQVMKGNLFSPIKEFASLKR